MFKFIVLCAFSLLLSSCFKLSSQCLLVEGILDSGMDVENEFKEYDANRLENYDLIYRFNGDTINIRAGVLREPANGAVAERYMRNFRNVFFKRLNKYELGYSLEGNVDVEVFLKSKVTGRSILLAKKTIDVDAYYCSIFLTQIFIGNDKEKYLTRTRNDNIDWSKMKRIVFANDTLYHYTGWYWDKSDGNDYGFVVEIP